MQNYRGLSLRDLGYIVAIAEELNFHRAAERCCVTQSTLSTQVGKCERYLGISIFDRDRHRVELTAVGTRVVQHARLVLSGADAIMRLRPQANGAGSTVSEEADLDHQSRIRTSSD